MFLFYFIYFEKGARMKSLETILSHLICATPLTEVTVPAVVISMLGIPLTNCGSIYWINCSYCSDFYVGDSTLQLVSPWILEDRKYSRMEVLSEHAITPGHHTVTLRWLLRRTYSRLQRPWSPSLGQGGHLDKAGTASVKQRPGRWLLPYLYDRSLRSSWQMAQWYNTRLVTSV